LISLEKFLKVLKGLIFFKLKSDVWLLYRVLWCMGNTSFPCCVLSRKIPDQRDADAFNKDYSNPTQSPEQVLRQTQVWISI